MEQIKNKLRQLSLMADAIVATHLNHEHRWQRVIVLRRLVMLACGHGYTRPLPLWADTLIALLDASNFESGVPSYIDHTEAKAALRMFSEMCKYIVENMDNHWFEPAWTRYRYDGEPEAKRIPSPFFDFADVDEPDQTPDIPFGAGVNDDDEQACMYSCGCHVLEDSEGNVLQVLSTCSDHFAENWLNPPDFGGDDDEPHDPFADAIDDIPM